MKAVADAFVSEESIGKFGSAMEGMRGRPGEASRVNEPTGICLGWSAEEPKFLQDKDSVHDTHRSPFDEVPGYRDRTGIQLASR